MIFTKRRPVFSHWTNYGSLTLNISDMTGQPDAEQDSYLALVKQAYPPTPGIASWVRHTRYGIVATTSVPSWDTDDARYWPNMYFRVIASDVMTGRKLMFEPILWTRQNGSQAFMCNPNAGPSYFGRDTAGTITIADESNTWRNNIRINLDRLSWEDVS